MLVLLVALGALLRALYLDRQSLWFDEGVGLIFSGCEVVSGCLEAMLRTRTSERFQLLYPLLLHEWRVLFGSGESALRSLSVLFNVAALVIIAATARRVFGTAHAAWSLAFMALSGFTLVHAQEARPYAFFLMIAAAQLYLITVAREGSRNARLGLYAVTALAAWAGLFPLLFSVALALADLADRGLSVETIRRWFIRWLPAGLLCLPAVLYYGHAAIDMPPDDVLVPRSQQPLFNAAFLVYGHFVGQTFGPPVEALRGPARFDAIIANAPLLAALVAVLTFGAVHGWRLWRAQAWNALTGARVLVLTALSYCALLLLFAALTRHNLLPRHAIALHPLLALLLPCLITPSPRGGRPYAGHAFMGALLALNLVSVGRHYFDRTQWKDDYRGAAAYLEQVGEPQRPVLLLRGLPVLFAYYGYDKMTVVMDPPQAHVPGVVADALGDRPELVIVVNRETDLWPTGWLETTLAPDLRLTRKQELSYFSIYTFVRR
ncbi:MAG TPA: glycosyltransferase family 39 protein [Alphaproteobacteria bacterium]|nr:glycosyltransferase family 39 protein [Alphaproteobacteria bacterium]